MGGAIGVDVGGTKCLGVVLDRDDAVIAEHRVATPASGPSLVAAVSEVVAALRPSAAGQVPVGVGVPGLVDHSGMLRFAPHLRAVTDFALRDELLAGPLAGVPLVVDNDATCAVWAEHRLGAARGASHVLMATLGTGIGGGLILDGRLQRGSHGFAGEIGHVVVDPQGPQCPCGRQGCWERYASGSGLGRMAREAAEAGVAPRVVELAGGDPEEVRGEHLTVAAAEGDQEAREVMARFAWWVALGLANLAAVLDPELIVLGGGMIEAGPVLLEPTSASFHSLLEGAAHRPAVPLVAAQLGARAGAIGAALLARSAPAAG